ncbi:MAG: methionine adenosyltransferase [Promethearchaeota archaeon]
MNKAIIVEPLRNVPLREQKIEIVERKGLGHPDNMCDAIMDRISVRLSQEYLKKAGTILHHNIDKALLAAGEVEHAFGGGHIIKPMRLIIGDRATKYYGNEVIPVDEIAIQTAKDWLKANMRFVDPEKHMVYQIELKEGSEELKDIFKMKEGILEANDTSAAVGYAPLTYTEKTVLSLERYLNSRQFKSQFPETGEDVKIMGHRTGNRLHLTVAMPFFDLYIDSEETYFRKKREVLEKIETFVTHELVEDAPTLELAFNALDREGKGISGLYLTTLGTSAESADSGQVGRGNRANGLITLNRPVSSEAAAGKNPVSHVGKIYSLLSHKIANEIYTTFKDEVEEAYVWLLSKIGQRIDKPELAAAQIIMKKGKEFLSISEQINELIESSFQKIDELCNDLALGRYPVA